MSILQNKELMLTDTKYQYMKACGTLVRSAIIRESTLLMVVMIYKIKNIVVIYIVDNSDALDRLMDQDYGRDSQHNLAGEGTALKTVFGNAYILITIH